MLHSHIQLPCWPSPLPTSCMRAVPPFPQGEALRKLQLQLDGLQSHNARARPV